MQIKHLVLGLLALLMASLVYAQPFTYQGMLKENGTPANGTFSMTFKLFDAPTGGNQIGSTITRNVRVENGLLTETLDFGAVWNGADRYLEITVGSTVLSPRVKVNPVPYAVFAQRPWQTGGSNIFYTDGNVGIGTNNPAVRLSLGGGDANTKLALWQGNTASDVMGFGIAPNQFRIHLHNPTNRFSFLDAPNGNEVVTIRGSGNLGIGTTDPSQRLHVVGNGVFTNNVGIGTTSPTERLHVAGNIRLADDSSIFGLDRLIGFNDLRLYGDAQEGVHGPDLYISRLGFVGVRTADPQAELHVRGWAFVTGGSGPTTLQIVPGHLMDNMRANAATLEIPGNGTLGIWDSLEVAGNLLVRGNWSSVGGGGDPYSHWRVACVASDRSNGAWVGEIWIRGANESSNVVITSHPEHLDHGYVGVCNAAGNVEGGLTVDRNGYGVIWADVKSFRVPDPEDPTRDIWYASVEGPEAAMYARGTARLVNGRARIELPDHFRKLADEQGMTVQLTPRSGESKGLAAVRVSLDGIEVVELLNGRGNYEFDWRVEAVRKAHRDFQVYRSWDESLSGGVDPVQAWEARLKSIQARQERQARQQTMNAKP